MSLSTKDVNVGGGNNISKLIEPGNITATIGKVELDQPNFLQKDQGYYLVLHLEGPDLGDDFEGFFIDKDDESLGRHKCQVGRVKYSKWPFKDGETKSGIQINRDTEILKALKNLCTEMDITDWFEAQDNKHDTIEEFVTAFNQDAPYAGKPLNYCVAARQYHKQNGYLGNDCYLPKYNKNAVPFEEISASPSRIAMFDEAIHVEKPQPVEGFTGDDGLANDDAEMSVPSGNFDI